MTLRLGLLGLLVALAGGCVSLHEEAGVPLDQAIADGIVPGRSTRRDVLARLGPPTGYFRTDLRALVTRVGAPVQSPWTPNRIDDDVFTYQKLDVRGNIFFFPILFVWADADVEARTLIVFFRDDGVGSPLLSISLLASLLI